MPCDAAQLWNRPRAGKLCVLLGLGLRVPFIVLTVKDESRFMDPHGSRLAALAILKDAWPLVAPFAEAGSCQVPSCPACLGTVTLSEVVTFHVSAWGRGGAHKEPRDLSPRFRSLASPLGTGQVHQECGPSPGAGEAGRPASLWARVAGGTLSPGRARGIWALKDRLVFVCRQGRKEQP